MSLRCLRIVASYLLWGKSLAPSAGGKCRIFARRRTFAWPHRPALPPAAAARRERPIPAEPPGCPPSRLRSRSRPADRRPDDRPVPKGLRSLAALPAVGKRGRCRPPFPLSAVRRQPGGRSPRPWIASERVSGLREGSRRVDPSGLFLLRPAGLGNLSSAAAALVMTRAPHGRLGRSVHDPTLSGVGPTGVFCSAMKGNG